MFDTYHIIVVVLGWCFIFMGTDDTILRDGSRIPNDSRSYVPVVMWSLLAICIFVQYTDILSFS